MQFFPEIDFGFENKKKQEIYRYAKTIFQQKLHSLYPYCQKVKKFLQNKFMFFIAT